jgi:hypothetical protein
MTFKLPSLLIVRGIDSSDNECDWYAEAVGKIHKEGSVYYEVYYLIPDSVDSQYLVYDDEYDIVPIESVKYIQPVAHGDYAMAWLSLGICFPCDNGKYLKVSEPMTDDHVDDDTDDMDSQNSYSTIESTNSDVSDLIDDTDDSCQCGTDCTCTLCKDMITCQRQFDEWVPTNERERATKDFITRMEDAVVSNMIT